MRTPTPVEPRNSWQFSRIARATCGSGSARNACARRPNGEPDTEDYGAWPSPLLLFGARAAHSSDLRLPAERAGQHSPYQHRDVVSGVHPPLVYPSRSDPMSVPEVSRRGPEPRWRLSTAGFQSRQPADCACCLFFPRSVGFGPTASCASGALTIAPSMLCHAQAIPSISSYSASPFRQSRTNTFLRFHSRKYLWIELALPNRSSGNAFHWHPVRKTYTIPANTFRGSSGLRPPPGFRRYFRRFSRPRFGTNGSTFAHISSDTVQDRIALMPRKCLTTTGTRQDIIYG